MTNAEARIVLERFNKDHIYIEENQEHLLEQFPESWVVVYNEEVLGQAPNLNEALEIAREKRIEEHLAVRFLTTTPVSFIL